jgi:hypothetical protein
MWAFHIVLYVCGFGFDFGLLDFVCNIVVVGGW